MTDVTPFPIGGLKATVLVLGLEYHFRVRKGILLPGNSYLLDGAACFPTGNLLGVLKRINNVGDCSSLALKLESL